MIILQNNAGGKGHSHIISLNKTRLVSFFLCRSISRDPFQISHTTYFTALTYTIRFTINFTRCRMYFLWYVLKLEQFNILLDTGLMFLL